MSTKYVILNNANPQFVTLRIVGFIKLFDEEARRRIVLDALRFAQEKKNLIIHAYVIMPSHLHMILRAGQGPKLWEILRDFKKFTSKQIVKSLEEENTVERKWPLQIFRDKCLHLKNHREFKVWKEGYRAIDVSTEMVFYQKLTYIHNNPVKAGMVESAEQFEFSSAKDYVGGSSVLEVTSI